MSLEQLFSQRTNSTIKSDKSDLIITPIDNTQNSKLNIITIQGNQLTIPNNNQNSVSMISNISEEKKEFWVRLPYKFSSEVGGYLQLESNIYSRRENPKF